MLLLPALQHQLLGVSIGVLFNAAFPTWLITTLLICMLVFMSVKTGQKGLSLWRTETTSMQRRQQQQQSAHDSTSNSNGTADSSNDPAAGALPVSSNGAAPAAVVVVSDAAADGDGKPRRAPYPWPLALVVLFLWVGFSGLQLLRQATERCSPAYFAVTAAQVSVVNRSNCCLRWTKLHANEVPADTTHSVCSDMRCVAPQPHVFTRAAHGNPFSIGLVVCSSFIPFP
jgi:hypothetical protein